MAPATTTATTTGSAGCNQSDQTVTVTLFDNPVDNRCDVKNVDPHVVDICASFALTWKFESTCASDVTVEIGKRSRLYPHGTQTDPIDATNFNSTTSVTGGSGTITATIAANAEEAVYKYPIIVAGRTVDPEIDVRRGDGPGPRPPSPRASPSGH
jgi:hypothetical protein